MTVSPTKIIKHTQNRPIELEGRKNSMKIGIVMTVGQNIKRSARQKFIVELND